MKKQQKPKWLIYSLVTMICSLFVKMRFKIKLVKLVQLEKKKPYLILCNHPSNFDFIFSSLVLRPKRMSVLTAYYYWTNKFLGRMLDNLGAIPKRQFSSDINSIKRIKQVLNLNGTVVIMPEGTVVPNGAAGFVPSSIAKLIKFVNCDVLSININGANLAIPKWKTSGYNKIPITVTLDKLFSAEQTQTLNAEQIYHNVLSALTYNEFDYANKINFNCKSKDKANGITNLLYKCPNCHAEFTLTTLNNKIICSNCNMQSTFNERMSFIYNIENNDLPANYSEWYDYQCRCVKYEINKGNFYLNSDVNYLTHKKKNGYQVIGSGRITMTSDAIIYTGTIDGVQTEKIFQTKCIPVITYSSGNNFELPITDIIHCFAPKDPRVIIKWVIANRLLYDALDN